MTQALARKTVPLAANQADDDPLDRETHASADESIATLRWAVSFKSGP